MLHFSEFFDQEQPPAQQSPFPPSCNFCGSGSFSQLEDTGRGDRAICAQCGGAMLRPYDGVWDAALPNSTHNNPSTEGDYTQKGAGGLWQNKVIASSDENSDAYRRDHSHQASTSDEDDSPLHHLDKVTFPSDVYTHPHYYQSGNPGEQHAINVARSVRGKPDADVHIYRALPAEHAHHGIQPGDWVSTSPDYARQHGFHHDDSAHDWPVVHAVVPAKHLHTEGDLLEYGYSGTTAPKTDIHFKGGYHQQVSEKSDGSITPVTRRTPKEASLEKFAHWSDVVAKARRLRREGSVHIVATIGIGVDAVVRGDHGIYDSQVTYQPGTRKTAHWQCGCKFALYADGPRWKNRPCSHVLAVRFQVQSKGMWGRQVAKDSEQPEWLSQRTAALDGIVPDNRSNDARRDSEKFGDGVPDWGLPLVWCPQCQGLGCGHCGGSGQAVVDGDSTGSPLPDESKESGQAIRSDGLTASKKDSDDTSGPSVAGLVVKAEDTGRVLMLQRGMDDEDDPARGLWEFPGGHIEDEDVTPLHGAIREWEEEVGQLLPEKGSLKSLWESPNGVYAGHVLVIPSESDLIMYNGRVVPNPDDPHGDHSQQAAWWEVDHAKKNPALRPECSTSPWKDIAAASLSKEAAAWDPLYSLQDAPTHGPDHSDSENPGSTGFATGQDPDGWNQLGKVPNHISSDDIMATGSKGQHMATNDISRAATAHLRRTAMKNFSHSEQQELINEGKGIRARNFSDLQLAGTHYQALQSAIDAAGIEDDDLLIL